QGCVGGGRAVNGFGATAGEAVCEADGTPLMRVRGWIGMTERGLHPDVTIAHFDGADWYVVRPQIESAAAFEIEASVVPVTGQDAVLDAAALEREAHVRAAIIKR